MDTNGYIMYACMDVCIYGCMHLWMYAFMDVCMGCMYGWMDGYTLMYAMDVCMGCMGLIDGWESMDEWNGLMGGLMDEWIDG